MINVGIVGYGLAGKYFHSYLIGLAEGLKVCAVAARSEETRKRAEADLGVKTFASLSAMLEDEQVQLVVLATPHNTHAQMAMEAMDAGRHVVTDKIMCMNGREADEMIAASKRNKVMLSVFHNRRWDWDYLTLRHALDQGLLGQPFYFESNIGQNRRPGGWRADRKQSGTLLFDWGAHLVDQALQLVPSGIKSVFCEIQDPTGQVEVGAHGRMVIRFENDVLFEIEVCYLTRIERPRWYVLGTEGTFQKYGRDPQEPYMIEGRIDEAQEPPEHRARVCTSALGVEGELVLESVRGNWRSYYENISAVLNEGAELAVKPEEVRRVMAVFDAALESAETGQAVEPK